MDVNIGIPISMCIVGMGLFVVAAMFPQTSIKGARISFANTPEKQSVARRVYHVSEKKIENLTNTPVINSPLKPEGLWYSIDKKGWLNYIEENISSRHKKAKYLYTLSIMNDAKIFVIDSVEDVLRLCKKLVVDKDDKGETVDWNLVIKEYDGVEVKHGVKEKLRLALKHPAYKKKGFLCIHIFEMFDIASGCVWNVDKVSILSCEIVK
jgi:hypothetical protein